VQLFGAGFFKRQYLAGITNVTTLETLSVDSILIAVLKQIAFTASGATLEMVH
jgi:hypothetical protein